MRAPHPWPHLSLINQKSHLLIPSAYWELRLEHINFVKARLFSPVQWLKFVCRIESHSLKRIVWRKGDCLEGKMCLIANIIISSARSDLGTISVWIWRGGRSRYLDSFVVMVMITISFHMEVWSHTSPLVNVLISLIPPVSRWFTHWTDVPCVNTGDPYKATKPFIPHVSFVSTLYSRMPKPRLLELLRVHLVWTREPPQTRVFLMPCDKSETHG